MWEWLKDLMYGLSWQWGLGVGLFLGIIGTTASVTKFRGDFETMQKENAEFKKILFKDKGGMNVLTEDSHQRMCETNIELFDSQLEAKLGPVRADIQWIKNALQSGGAGWHQRD